jgi:hypothetical protein
MARQVILKVEDDKNIFVETDFSQDELEEVAEKIQEDLQETDEGWNEDKIIAELEKKGYIKVVGPAPEIYDLYLF